MQAHLERHELHVLRLDYARPLRWAGSLESGMDVVLLVIRAGGGAVGVAETPIRLKWHSASVRSFTAALEDVVLPALADVDLLDASATAEVLSRVREHPLAKSLVDMACWDLRSNARQVPLWQALGGQSPAVPFSFTVNRASPEEMAGTARRVVEGFGVCALKVKTGQGIDADRRALRGIRDAVGARIELFADSNGAHSPDDVPAMSAMLADFGVSYFEDPCAMLPDSRLRGLLATCRLPVLVDDGCRSLRDATLFLDAGAEALSVKTMKTGLSESLRVADKAAAAGAKVSVGISATTSLGAVMAMSLASALPQGVQRIPCEETFFLNVPGVLREDLVIESGLVRLPVTAGLHDLLDWDRIQRMKMH